MQSRISKVLLCCTALLIVTGLVACKQPTPEERVAAARAKYRVTLNTFVAQEPAMEEMTDDGMMDATDGMDEGEEMAMDDADATSEDADMAADEMSDGDMAMDDAAASGPQPTDILLDLVVLFEGNDPLDGLTLDISQADPFEKEKATFRHYIEIPSMVKSETRQVSFVLEGVDYEVGDLFSVNLREYVAPEDRAAYREFAEAK